MSRQVLLDTGPLVAYLVRREQHHAWAKQQWMQVEAPMLTCEAVLSEACFLLNRTRTGCLAVLEFLARGVVQVSFRLDVERASVARLIKRYADVPMSLADACLVRMSELHPDSTVFTLDRDFRRYRRQGRRVIPTIMPAESR